MLRVMGSSRFKAVFGVALLSGALAGRAPVAAQEESGGVEILTGGGAGADASPERAGIRVMSFVDEVGGSPTYRVVQPLRGTEVLAIQRALASAGYEPGALDGLMGSATRKALGRFQVAAGTPPCACVDYASIVGLGLRPLVVQTVIGSPESEPAVEIIVPSRPVQPESAAPAPPSVDTVFVGVADGPDRSWPYPWPGFPVGVPIIVGSGGPSPSPAPPAGVPFGGRGPIRLGPPTPTAPPPPR